MDSLHLQKFIRAQGKSDQARANELNMSRSMVNKMLAGNLSWPLVWLLEHPAAAVALLRDSIERINLVGADMPPVMAEHRDETLADLRDLQGAIGLLQQIVEDRIAESALVLA
jgi:hypothetical protein